MATSSVTVLVKYAGITLPFTSREDESLTQTAAGMAAGCVSAQKRVPSAIIGVSMAGAAGAGMAPGAASVAQAALKNESVGTAGAGAAEAGMRVWAVVKPEAKTSSLLPETAAV